MNDKNEKTIDGRYIVLRAIGKGMSGEVLLVRDSEGTKALKLLNELQLNVSRAEALANFKKEFAILKELNHPHVARILDFGYEGTLRKYFFTSEFVDGADFQTACTGLSPERIEALAVQALRALNYLHARGVRHFDIKPQNVLVATDDGTPGSVKIIDFGLAEFTAPHKKTGTPAYMAPEILRGESPDHRADLYSLGVMTYKAFTGVNPFVGKSLRETCDRQLNFNAAPPSTINPSVPKHWDHILIRLLEKNPMRRYAEAAHAIRDVNFLGRAKHEIETHDTKLSYLPEKGALIGREAEWKTFQDAFEASFGEGARSEPSLFTIAGGKGTGKTRFVAEIRHAAQLKGVPIRVFDAAFHAANLPERSVLCLDDGDVAAERVNDLLRELGGRRCLVVWTCANAPFGWKAASAVALKDFSRGELGEYLGSVTGFGETPAWLVEKIYRRTQGNPFFVAEFVKSLIERGAFFDSAGRWHAAELDDVRIDFDAVGIPATLEDCLRVNVSRVTAPDRAILNALAVNGAPLDALRLATLTGEESGPALDRLKEQGLLETAEERGFFFKNVFVSDVILKDLPVTEQSGLHARLAELFDAKPESRRLHLHHRGFDPDPDSACAALKELGRMHIADGEYGKAVTVFERLIARRESRGELANLSDYLDLGKALTLTRRLSEASALHAYLLTKLEARRAPADDVLEVLKELVDLRFKRSDVGTPDEHLAAAGGHNSAATALIARSSKPEFWKVVFENFGAFLSLRTGRLDEALATFRKTHDVWKLELSDDDKALVLNNRIVEALHQKRDYAAAEAVCLEKMPTLATFDEKYPLALNCYWLATTYYLMATNESRTDAAELHRSSAENFRRCDKIARDIGNLPLLLRALNGIGNVLMTSGDKSQALEYYERAFSVSRRSGETETAAFIAYNVATIHKDAGNDREAYSHFIYAANTLDERPARTPYADFILFMTRLLLVETDLRLGDTLSAREELERADALYETCAMAKSYESLRSLYRAQLFFHEGDFHAGDEWLGRALEQCATPEQRLIVEKYTASPRYRDLSAKH
jgi:tetratricopeptide (TPR) repeat protein/predicted Ser/Thr protein kinase